jgi:pectate lyase
MMPVAVKPRRHFAFFCLNALAIVGLSFGLLGCAGTAAKSTTATNPTPPVNAPSTGQPGSSVTSVTITPGSSSSTTGATLQFSATVSGSTTTKTVSWKASLGQITPSGVYTAPSQPGTDMVTATSDADTSETASAQVTVTAANNGPLPAFPGAQGGGAAAVGGRGGEVIEVTNLQDSGSGSLRACVEASGPRTCVFRVSGLITSRSQLTVSHPYITIAGQTAPGGGIVIGGLDQEGEQLAIETHDVIVRYLTYDGNSRNRAGPETGSVGFELANGIGDVYNVVLDHVSARWAGNKAELIYANDITGERHVKNTSFQWSLVYEPNIDHPVGLFASAIAFPAEDVNNDYHHNLVMNFSHRDPLNYIEDWRYVSNITYNWSTFAAGVAGEHADFINNYWVPGNLNGGDPIPHPVQVTEGVGQGNCLAHCDLSGTPSIHMSGNICSMGKDYQCSAAEKGDDPEGYPEVRSPIPPSWQRDSALDAEPFPISADAADTLDKVVLPTVGNSQHLNCSGNFVSNRDSQDARVVAQYIARGPGGEYGGPHYKGPESGPSIPAGTPCQESQHDGIPDQWKAAKGLSTTDRNVHKTIAPNGYTWLENYLNGQ